MAATVGEYVKEIGVELLSQDGHTTPQAICALVLTRFGSELTLFADQLRDEAITRAAHQFLRGSVKRAESKQLQLTIPGYELPAAIPLDSPDGKDWYEIGGITREQWLSWENDRRHRAQEDLARIDLDADFRRFAERHGWTGSTSLRQALARAGVII